LLFGDKEEIKLFSMRETLLVVFSITRYKLLSGVLPYKFLADFYKDVEISKKQGKKCIFFKQAFHESKNVYCMETMRRNK
jgi:hypothetical protein